MPDKPRCLALDDLRGWAVLGMALSGLLPWGALPAWMYHAQTPPPDMVFNQKVYGITWVDLVFPFFLFAMGAAMALSEKEEEDPWKKSLGLVWRFAYLCLFGILTQNTRHASLPEPGLPSTQVWCLVLGGLMLAAFSRGSGEDWRRHLRPAGAAILAGLIVSGAVPIKWASQDIIIMVLATCSLAGGLVFWKSPHSDGARLAVVGVALVAFMAKEFPGPVKDFWNWQGASLIYRAEYLKYLAILAPGMVVGGWLKEGDWKEKPLGTSAWVGALAIPICLVGLLSRQLGWTILACSVLGALCMVRIDQGHAWHRPAAWAWGLLLTGLIAEPLGGGIRKDTTTVSYFLVTAGLAILFLFFLIEVRRALRREEAVGWVTMVGMNALVGYLAITHFVPPLVRLAQIEGWVGGLGLAPWGLFVYSLAQTVLVAGLTVLATRARLFARA